MYLLVGWNERAFTLLSVPFPWFRINSSQFGVPAETLPNQMLSQAPFLHLLSPLLVRRQSWELEAQKLQIMGWNKNNLVETKWDEKTNCNCDNINKKSIRQRNYLHGKWRWILTNPSPPCHPPGEKVLLPPSQQWCKVVLSNIINLAVSHPTDLGWNQDNKAYNLITFSNVSSVFKLKSVKLAAF